MKTRNLLMVSVILAIVFIVFTLNVKAQNIGINSTGATPNSSAMLDIDVSAMAAKKGLLIPRVALTGISDITTISSPAVSLLIYNTATAGVSPNNIVPGYYYYNGTKWIKFATNTDTDWSTIGNLGTDPTINFIGTIDNNDLVIKTYNNEVMRVTASGKVGINESNPNSSLQVKTYANGILTNPFDGLKLQSPLNTNYNRGTLLGIEDGSISGVMGQNAQLWNFEPGFLRFGTQNVERMRIDKDGWFGFNETNPVSTFTIRPYHNAVGASYDGIRIIHPLFASNTTNGLLLGVDIMGNNATLTYFQNGDLNVSANSGNINFATNGFDRMKITTFGLVTIGNTNPLATLTIQDNVGFQPGLMVTNPSLASGTNGMLFGLNQGAQNNGKIWNYMSGDIEIGTNNSEIIRLSSNGRVGIGTTSPQEVLHVVGNTRISSLTGGNRIVKADVNGTLETLFEGTSSQVLLGDGTWGTVPGSDNNWLLTGNSGTNPATNFIGTIDDNDVIFKRQSVEGLRITTGGALWASGKTTTGVTPTSGAGRRMMWIPAKGAFRAGEAVGTEWDDANIGLNSFASGYEVIASGNTSTAMGGFTTSSGIRSTAMGSHTVASGNYSTAISSSTIASGTYSTAMGYESEASGSASTAMGRHSVASGASSTAMGYFSLASGDYSTAMGYYTAASGNYSSAMGTYTSTGAFAGSFILGDSIISLTTSTAANQFMARFKGGYVFYTDAAIAPSKTIVFNNGNVGIGIITPLEKLHVVDNTRISSLSGTGNRMTQADANGTLIPMTAGAASEVLLGTGVWGSVPGGGNNWFITGNSGTTPGTNFIGTTDSTVLIFKVNNHIAGRIGLLINTDGNTGLGNNTFRVLTTGHYNSAFGSQALEKNADGNNNSAFGNFALMSNISGGGNCAFGVYCLQFNTASYNSAFGNASMSANTYGASNSAFGNSALQTNRAGSRNTAIGLAALRNFSFDPGVPFISGNVAVGYEALLNTDPTAITNGINNTTVGYQAGVSNTTGYNNTYIGNNSGGAATINNSTAIGVNATVSISNAIVLGTAAENVGIGTSSPSAKLDITSNNRGVLIPRIALTGTNDVITIPTPANSLLIYNTATAGVLPNNVTPGYYYYNGAKWVSLSGGSGGNDWSLTGNAGTTAGTNFIGTTDDNDVVFKRNTDEGFRITTGGALLASGNIATGVTPTSGAGRRMMWIPEKGAFRVGQVTSVAWNNAQIGLCSFASGRDTYASGAFSTATGIGTSASGLSSTAMGDYSVASGDYSTTMGDRTTAIGYYSTAMGNATTAGGDNSTSMGVNSLAGGAISTAMGNGTTASGVVSIATGYHTLASGDYSIATGYETQSSGIYSTAIGRSTNASGLNSTSIGAYTAASGDYSTSIGYSSLASGGYSTAMGYYTTASGNYSTALGNLASTGGFSGSFILGDNSTMITTASTAANQYMARFNGGYVFYTDAALTPLKTIVFNNGNVGVGTTTPAFKIDISGNGRLSSTLTIGAYTLPATDGTSGQVLRTNGAGALTWQTLAGLGTAWGLSGNASTVAGTNYIGTTDAIDLVFKTNSTEWMRILSGGNIGIGIVAPSQKLHVLGSVYAESGGYKVFNTTNDLYRSSTGKYGGAISYDFNNVSTQAGIVLENGETESGGFYADGDMVGIWAPGDNDLLKIWDEDGMILRARVDGLGNWYAVSNNATSDVRLKKNIRPLNGSLNKILALNGKLFDWKEEILFKGELEAGKPVPYDELKNKIGFMAQDLELILPEVVSTNKNSGYKAVNYEAIIPVVTEAIKEQQKQIEDLKTIVAEQQKQINQLLNH